MDQVYLAASLSKIIYLEFCYHLCYLDLLSLNRHLLQKKKSFCNRTFSDLSCDRNAKNIVTFISTITRNRQQHNQKSFLHSAHWTQVRCNLKMISDRCNEYFIVHLYNVCNISFSTNNRVFTIDLLKRRGSICKALLPLSSMNLFGFSYKNIHTLHVSIWRSSSSWIDIFDRGYSKLKLGGKCKRRRKMNRQKLYWHNDDILHRMN